MAGELGITTNWLRERMNRAQPLFLIEVRHAGDWDLAVMKARGALRVDSDSGKRRLQEIPREQTVVIYSTAPADEPAEVLARLLAGEGHQDVHVLEGGFKAYLSAGLPVEEIGEGRNMTRLRGY
jgi:rhodanese-related sulfurtransferase